MNKIDVYLNIEPREAMQPIWATNHLHVSDTRLCIIGKQNDCVKVKNICLNLNPIQIEHFPPPINSYAFPSPYKK